MILADTSVWIDHFRQADPLLIEYLNDNAVAMHPFVLGEIALGNLSPRQPILAILQGLPAVHPATDEEVLGFISRENLFGQGIGYVDAHLLAAVRLTPGTVLWTRDKRLALAAARFGLAMPTARQ